MQLYSLLIACLIFASGLGYGYVLLRNRASGLFLFRLGLGLWVAGHLVLLAGLAGFLKTPLIWSVILAGVFLLFTQYGMLRKQLVEVFSKQQKTPSTDHLQKAGWVFLAIFAGMALIGALSPPVHRDSLVYHLALPKLYLQIGSWQEIPQNIFSYFPGFMESIYAIALGLGSEFPALVHFGFGLACLAATYELGRILSLKRIILMLCLTAIIVTPTFWSEMTWAYVDLANSFFWLMSIVAFFRWYEEKRTVWLILLGFSIGAACCCKYTSLLLFLVFPLGILFELQRNNMITARQVLVSVLLPTGTALLVVSPWWLRNILLTGNPVFPFFWDFFPSRSSAWDTSRTNMYSLMLDRYGGTGKGVVDYILAPINVFLTARVNDPNRYDGNLGWYYLLAVPVVLLGRKIPPKILYLIGLVVIYLGYWSLSSQQVRFLLVIVPIMSLLIGFVVQEILDILSAKASFIKNTGREKFYKFIVVAVILLSICFNAVNTLTVFNQAGFAEFISGKITKKEYLQNKLNYYAMYKYINENLPNDSYLFLVMTGNQGFYLERPYFSDSVFEGQTLRNILNRSSSSGEVLESFQQRGWSHLLIRPDFFIDELTQPNDKRSSEFFVDLLNNKLELQKISGPYWLLKIP